ncbi:hypothetical protein Taro_040157 [Colocasia esculenta]|uniref:Protein DAMAGED DNA-BINDING 2 n=1 Tax=Colocasia esculenta TaxID=4460 RepID=A0A843WIB8_COLES|nr:hypothetical protein [Colocasia esculenta]
MAPAQTRARPLASAPSASSFSRALVYHHDDTSSPSSSSSEDEEEEEEEPVLLTGRRGGVVRGAEEGGRSKEEKQEEPEAVEPASEAVSGKKKTAPITLSLKRVCKVCKGTGHEAGFRGATYIDCPKKPCFLCKMPGHTTISCPHRVAVEHGTFPARCRESTQTHLDFVFERQLRGKLPVLKSSFVIPDQVDCGVVRFHSRRVTCLEFHPTKNSVLLSGDKKGQLGIWNYGKLHEKTIYGSIHSCILNNMKFNPANDGVLYTSSSDGTVHCTDIETGISSCLMDLNPDGWNGPASWRMFYGLDVHSEKSLLLVADNFGYLYLTHPHFCMILMFIFCHNVFSVDARSQSKVGDPMLIHKKGSKVVGLHCNPVQPDMLISCGNDHFARIWDVRQLEDGSSLCSLAHSRVVNSAYFSPLTGSKILTTSQDNRIRVWDSIFGDLDHPSREIVHSHDFNRHLTPFRAEWDPKDPSESLAVVGRYISENYNGVALHPIDFIDTSTGQLLAEVTEPQIMTISPVNKLHPREDILASGSSRSIFIWKPNETEESDEGKSKRKSKEFVVMGAEKKCKGKLEADSDDDFDLDSKGKKPKSQKYDRKKNAKAYEELW